VTGAGDAAITVTGGRVVVVDVAVVEVVAAVVILVGVVVVVTAGVFGTDTTDSRACFVTATSRTATDGCRAVLTCVTGRRVVTLTADEGATGEGRLLITMPVASPSVSTPVTTHERIART
jgi:hypothetical protein